MKHPAIVFQFLVALAISVVSADVGAVSREFAFVRESSRGDLWHKRTSDIHFASVPSRGDMFSNPTIDVYISPCSSRGDMFSNPTADIYLAPRPTENTLNIYVGESSKATTDIFIAPYTSRGSMYEKRTTDIYMSLCSSRGDMFSKPTVDIHFASSSSRGDFDRKPTTDIYVDRELSREQLVAILVEMEIITANGFNGALAAGDSYMATAVSVHDGDTMRVERRDGTVATLRLAKVDAPELRQPYGIDSRNRLLALVKDCDLTVKAVDTDRYGREIAEVFIGDLNVNLQMVRTGFAWHYKRYDNSPEYALSESTARANRFGLWRDSNPVPPWEWRRGER